MKAQKETNKKLDIDELIEKSKKDGIASVDLDEALEEIQDEVPEVEYFVMYICEKDGDEIAVIDTRK